MTVLASPLRFSTQEPCTTMTFLMNASSTDILRRGMKGRDAAEIVATKNALVRASHLCGRGVAHGNDFAQSPTRMGGQLG